MKLGVYYSYYELYQYLEELHRQYFERFQLVNIGQTCQGRKIPMLIIGQGRPRLLATGSVHGRESINPTVLIAMAEQYIYDPGRLAIQKGQIYLIPFVNPDGYEIARQEDFLWKRNGRGVDINRNFPSRTFRAKWKGDRPGSEEETRILMRVMHQTDPDGYIDYHSRGKSIYFYRSQMDGRYNDRQYRIARQLEATTGYPLEEAADEIGEGDSGGNTVHFFSETFRRPAITMETVSESEAFPLNPLLQMETMDEIKDSFEVMMRAIENEAI